MAEIVRTCVVCKKKEEKRKLIRFVACCEAPGLSSEKGKSFSLLEWDLCGSMDGRAAYCHPDEQCLFHKELLRFLLFSLRRKEAAKGRSAGKISLRHEAKGLLGLGMIIDRALQRESKCRKEGTKRAKHLECSVSFAEKIRAKLEEKESAKHGAKGKLSRVRL